MIASFLVGVALLAPEPQICIAWIEAPKDYRLATYGPAESRDILAEGVEEIILLGLKKERIEAEGYRFIRNAALIQHIEFRSLKSRTIPVWKQVAEQTNAPILIAIDIIKLSQRNHAPSHSINKPNSAASETKVEFVVSLFDKKSESLVKFGENDHLRSEFGGPYFGTTDKYELHGDPTAVAAMIRQENVKRVNAIGNAVWNGTKRLFLDKLRQELAEVR